MAPEKVNRLQIWGFVAGGVIALLTFPIVGVLFGLAAVALTYRTPLPPARMAGLAIAAISVISIVFGIGGEDGGGLID